MWQSTWGCHPFPGCPVNTTPGGQCGQCQDVSQCGGCCPSVHPMGHNFQQGPIPGQWIPQRQEQWSQSQMPMGTPTKKHTPIPPVPATAQGSPILPFSVGVPHPIAPPTQSLGSTSYSHGIIEVQATHSQ